MTPRTCNPKLVKSLALAAALAGAFALPTIAGAAQVTLGGSVVCQSYENVSFDKDGNLSITCKPLIITDDPKCSIEPADSTIAVGGTVTFRASCTGGIGGWWNVNGGPSFSGTGGVGKFESEGDFIYYIWSSDKTLNASAKVKVLKGDQTGSSGTCTSAQTVGPDSRFTDIGNLRFNLRPGDIGTKQWTYPSEGRRWLRIGTIFGTSSETPPGTHVQVAVSKCAGDFNVPAGCVGNFSTNGGTVFVGDDTECPLADGSYYLNIRQIKMNLNASPVVPVSPQQNSCSPSSGVGYCTHYTGFNGG